MNILPGWDSVESTAAIAHALHITAVIVLGLLFLAEGLAFVYDFRRDHLVGNAERIRADEQEQNNKRHAAEVEALQQKFSLTEAKIADRNLSTAQQEKIAAELLPYAGQKINIIAVPGEPEVNRFTDKLVGILKAARWPMAIQMGQDVGWAGPGVLIQFAADADITARSAAQALASSLRNEGIFVVGPSSPIHGKTGGFSGQEYPDAKIRMMIGKKP